MKFYKNETSDTLSEQQINDHVENQKQTKSK